MDFKPNHCYLIQTENMYNFQHFNNIVFCFMGYISVYEHEDFVYGKLADGRPIQFRSGNGELRFIQLPKACWHLYS